MTGADASPATPWLFTLMRESMAWAKTEGFKWIFVCKAILAALLALWLSMRFELDQPRTAMITVFIVMRPQTGMILTKSLYRIGGTLTGAMVSLLLVSLFAQERVLFLLGLALWIGICTAGSAFYRDFKAYGFVLAGYSTTLIGLAAASQPELFFSIAATRLSEVTLGILCAGVINDVILPQRLSDQIASNVQNRYADFMAFVRTSLSGKATRTELEAIQVKLVGNVLALESIRTAAVWEDREVRSRDLKLRKLNSEFMAASNTFYSFHQLLKRLTKNATPAGQALNEIYESLGRALAATVTPPRSANTARIAARRIAIFRNIVSRKAEAAKKNDPTLNDPQNALDFETALELLHRFLRELHTYTRTYATMPEDDQGPKPPDDIGFVSHTDPLAALLAGGRAFVSILLVGLFWISSAWTYGASALTFVAIASALFGSAPDQYRSIRHMILGQGAGYVAAILFQGLIMPSLDGFMMLSAAFIPFLIPGPYLGSHSKGSMLGIGYVVFFCAMSAPRNPMEFNPLGVVNEGGAMFLGVSLAGLAFMALVPATGAWYKRRMAGQIRRQVATACFAPLSGLVNRFEGATSDLLHNVESTKHLDDDQNQRLIAWIYSVKEIGRAVIHAREDAAHIRMPHQLSDKVREGIGSTARLFRRISARHRDEALMSVTTAIEAVHHEAGLESYTPHERSALRRLLASLHLIRTALLDDETALAAALGGPSDYTMEELGNAA